jgi:hypothetical protein
MIKELKNWEIATIELAGAFMIKYYGGEKAIVNYNWIGDEVGDVLQVGDYDWNVGNMIDALRFNCSEERLFEWYDLTLEAGMGDRPCQNLRTYAQFGLITKA